MVVAMTETLKSIMVLFISFRILIINFNINFKIFQLFNWLGMALTQLKVTTGLSETVGEPGGEKMAT